MKDKYYGDHFVNLYHKKYYRLFGEFKVLFLMKNIYNEYIEIVNKELELPKQYDDILGRYMLYYGFSGYGGIAIRRLTENKKNNNSLLNMLNDIKKDNTNRAIESQPFLDYEIDIDIQKITKLKCIKDICKFATHSYAHSTDQESEIVKNINTPIIQSLYDSIDILCEIFDKYQLIIEPMHFEDRIEYGIDEVKNSLKFYLGIDRD